MLSVGIIKWALSVVAVVAAVVMAVVDKVVTSAVATMAAVKLRRIPQWRTAPVPTSSGSHG